MTLNRLETPIPFSLSPDTGALSIPEYEATFSSGMSLQDFEILDGRFQSVVKSQPYTGTDLAFAIKPEKLANGTWFYVNLGFSKGALRILGFGWGKLRGGFYELTKPEFQEQLRAFQIWLESVLGPSLPCNNPRRVYRKQLTWGMVEAVSDPRTELPGIGIQFVPAHPPSLSP